MEREKNDKLITVLMPTYNSEKYISEAIDSVLVQTYSNWELLIISEYGSNRETLDIIESYCLKDARIRMIQNQTKLGLAESLNEGMRQAQGYYIARLDADDIAHPTRLEKQCKFMEEHQDVILCGTYQHHFGPGVDSYHKPPVDSNQCKANLLFFCDMCHSTVMFRKNVFLENNLFYDDDYNAEDFELWTRVMLVGEVSNIPEVLGEYRWDGNNITQNKLDALNNESGCIVGKTLNNTLGIILNAEEMALFNNWTNPYQIFPKRKAALKRLKEVLKNIYKVNKECQCFDEIALIRSISAKWRWARYGDPFNLIKDEKSIRDVFKIRLKFPFFNRIYYFFKLNKGLKAKVRKLYSKVAKR